MSGFSLVARRQLEGLGGLVDEWFFVGMNLRISGTLGILPGQADVVLAPGYPIFVSAVAALAGRPADTSGYFVRCLDTLFLAQALLLAGAAAMLFLWLSRRVAGGVALASALVLGTNPYCVLLTGLLHYDVLHIFCLVATCWVWQLALDDPGRRPTRMLWSGLLWGVSTLIRPVTLVFPPFALAALLVRERGSMGRALARCSLLVLGMVVVIGPYTLRNHRVTGRWVAVNAEGWMAVWASTVRELEIDPNHYRWGELYADAFMPVFTRVTGQPTYTRAAFIAHNLDLEDAFRREAISNIRERPTVYLRNCARSFTSFNLQINSVFVKAFRHIQQRAVWPRQDWFTVGHPQNFGGSVGADAFSAFTALLTVLAFGGVWLALRRGDAWVLAPGSAYLAICAAHTVVYMDLMYYYVKLPFLAIFAAVLLDGLGGRRLAAPLTAASLGALILLSLSSTVSFLVFSNGY